MTDNNKFLGYFWDLASHEDNSKRLAAATNIISYLVASESNSESSSSLKPSVDTDYALKRLIRGLGSSREAARQGFATCLCEVLKFPSVSLAECLKLLDEHTKVTGSMKGAEERDMLFGKLFGYISIIRSGKLNQTDNEDTAVEIFNRVLELHQKRGWIREVTSETILLLLESLNFTLLTNESVFSKLQSLLSEISISEMAPWQLMLALGFQFYQSIFPAVSSQISLLLPDEQIFIAERMDVLSPILLASTAGFPKIHRVWDYILGFIFGMTKDRSLPTTRLSVLSANQVNLLRALSTFIDKQLVTFSHEKRGVAMKLATEMVRIVPVSFISLALSKVVVRSLYSARVNRKHTLHNLAGTTISNIVKAAGSDSQCRLALASAFVHYGSANFDSMTGMHVVSELLEGLEIEALESHIKSLCSSTRTVITQQESATSALDEAATGLESVAGAASAGGYESSKNPGTFTAILAAIEALVSLTKNSRIQHRGFICCSTISVLVRLSCFQLVGKTNKLTPASVNVDQSSKKKKSKKDKDVKELTASTSASGLFSEINVDNIIEVVNIIEESLADALLAASLENQGSDEADEDSLAFQYKKLAEFASGKLLAILSDFSHSSIHSLNIPAKVYEGKNESKTFSSEPYSAASQTSVMDFAIFFLHHISTKSPIEFYKTETLGEDIEVEGPKLAVEITWNALNQLRDISSTACSKLVNPFTSFISHSLFQALTSPDISVQVILDIVKSARQILVLPDLNGVDTGSSKALNAMVTAGSDDGSETEVEDVYAILLDASLELLAISGEHSIKGVRDAIKKLWAAIFHPTSEGGESTGNGGLEKANKVSLDQAEIFERIIDSVVDAVVGDDLDEDDDDVEEEDGEEEEEEDVEEGDEGEEEVKDKEPKLLSNSSKKSKRVEVEKKVDVEEEEEEEDEVIDGDELMKLMDESDSDSDDDGQGNSKDMLLQHTSEADGALAQLIKLKKEQRKEGLLAAKKKGYLIRTRAIDILEVITHRCEDGNVLFSLIRPLFMSFKKTLASTLVNSIQEGRAFEQRLQTFIEQKLCKKKLHLNIAESSIDDSEEESEDQITTEDISILCSQLSKSLNSPRLGERQVSHVCFLFVVKAISSTVEKFTVSSSAKRVVHDLIRELFQTYSQKKNNRIPSKFFDDIVSRNMDTATECLLDAIVSSSIEAKTAFLRADACRLLSEVLTHFKGLKPDSQTRVTDKLPDILDNILSVFQTCLNDAIVVEKPISDKVVATAGAVGLPAKRVKSMLQLGKDVLVFIKTHGIEHINQNGKRSKHVVEVLARFQSIFGAQKQLQSLLVSPIAVKLAEQICISSEAIISLISKSSTGASAEEQKVLDDGNNEGGDKKKHKKSKKSHSKNSSHEDNDVIIAAPAVHVEIDSKKKSKKSSKKDKL